MRQKTLTYVSDATLLVVAALWGGGFIAVKGGLNTMTPFVLASLRFLIATLVFTLAFRRKIGPITRDEWRYGSFVGFFLFLGFAFQTVGLQYTTTSKQGFLTATYVIMVPLIYWIISRKMPKGKVFLGSFLTFIGIGLVSLESSLALGKGDLLTLVCAIFFALHIISIDIYSKRMTSLKLAYIQILVASIFFCISALIFEPLPTSITPEGWQSVIYLGIFSTFLCFTLQTVAQKNTPASHASMLLSLESIFAAVFGVILLGEVLTSKMIVGCVLIFMAIILIEVEWDVKKRGNETP